MTRTADTIIRKSSDNESDSEAQFSESEPESYRRCRQGRPHRGRGDHLHTRQRKSPLPAKLPTLQGKATEDWIAFRVQFERISEIYGWTKLEKLIESLRGKATSFCGRLRKRKRESYETLRDTGEEVREIKSSSYAALSITVRSSECGERRAYNS